MPEANKAKTLCLPDDGRPPPHTTCTLVDTPKEDDNDSKENPVEDKPAEAPPKHRHQRRRSKSRRQKDSNTSTEDNNTSENAEDPESPIESTSEQDDWEDGQVNPDDLVGTRTRRIVITYQSPKKM